MTPLAPKEIGQKGERLPAIGLGTWAWGDKRFWRFDPEHGPEEARTTFRAAVRGKIRLIDTAERYADGLSERLVGQFVEESDSDLFVATKFAPFLRRITTSTLPRALDASLERLRLRQVDLYQIHYPFSLLPIQGLTNRLADAVELGRIRYAGVSNYSLRQMTRAHAVLSRRGVPLASNQVQYSLVHRAPEKNGLLRTCREMGVLLIAYSPLGMGVLGGNYRPGGKRVEGLRRIVPYFRKLERWQPLLEELDRLANQHEKSPAQIALNWLARQEGVLPIPGARNRAQAEQNAATMNFSITDEEAERLGGISSRCGA